MGTWEGVLHPPRYRRKSRREGGVVGVWPLNHFVCSVRITTISYSVAVEETSNVLKISPTIFNLTCLCVSRVMTAAHIAHSNISMAELIQLVLPTLGSSSYANKQNKGLRYPEIQSSPPNFLKQAKPNSVPSRKKIIDIWLVKGVTSFIISLSLFV